jgi:hypothetical protein
VSRIDCIVGSIRPSYYGKENWNMCFSRPAIKRVLVAALDVCVRWEFRSRDVVKRARMSFCSVCQSLAHLMRAGIVMRLSQGFYRLLPTE